MELMQTGTVYQGTTASAFQVGPEKGIWQVEFLSEVAVDPLGFTGVRFAFHPGDAKGKIVDVLNLVIGDESVGLISEGYVDLDMKQWQVVEISLEAFMLDAPLESILFSGSLAGTFYLDDIRLVAAPPPPSATAVTEDNSETLPRSFTLFQNYPNPFNSSTVIRFALPTSVDVELAVYNLAGQQVTTLVEGMREAGTYAVTWNGQDDDGRKLASGVYLYRLQAGDGKQVETRKLVLIR